MGFVALLECGILVPGLRIQAVSPTLEGGFLTTGPPGRSPILLYLKYRYIKKKKKKKQLLPHAHNTKPQNHH